MPQRKKAPPARSQRGAGTRLRSQISAIPDPGISMGAGGQQTAGLNVGQATGGPVPPDVIQRQPKGGQQPPQQMAQAQPQGRLEMFGRSDPAVGIDLPRLLQAAQDPWVAENPLYSGIINTLIEEQLRMNRPLDPLQKAQMEKLLLENENLRNPRMSPSEAANLDLDRSKFQSEQGERDRRFNLDVSKFDYERDKDRLPEFYDAYVKQEQQAGRPPLGILDFITRRNALGQRMAKPLPPAAQEWELSRPRRERRVSRPWDRAFAICSASTFPVKAASIEHLQEGQA